MNSVLITGATGKSGLYFLKTLADNRDALSDYRFGFIARSREKEQIIKSYLPDSRVHIGDLNDGDFAATVFREEKYGVLFHTAGILRSSAIVRAAADSGAGRLIIVSTTGVYSKYKAAGEAYRQTEKEIMEYIKPKGVALTILRPTMIYGTLKDNNVSVFLKMADRLRLFPVINGGGYPLQPVWCGDLGKAYYQVLANPDKTRNKVYILSGAEPVMLIDMLKIISSKLGVKNRFFSVPFPAAYACAWILYAVTLGKKDYREKVQRLVEPRAYSHKEAAEDFGYAPVSFEDGVEPLIEEYKKSR